MGKVFFVFDGIKYWWSGWFGCQLSSLEIFRLPAGTQRTLRFCGPQKDVELNLWRTERKGLFVEHAWAVSNRGTIDEHAARIRELQSSLRSII